MRRETFGRYQLLGLLGQGGMGRLYIAERRGIQGFVKIVALKRILPHLADSAQFREMFLHEARVAARLEHPNIVATYELGEVDENYFISMEYLPGEDFSAIIARCQGDRRIPIEVAAALAQQAAHGLHHAHEARDEQGRPIGLVHRDVNPRNVFLTYHGVVKLLDFGVVRGRESQRTVPGAFKGKYGYCAPEQLDGRPIDRRTDVFCLGIVLWECLTGARLFEASTDANTIDAVRARPIPPPSELRPEIPRALDEIALRALARDPAERFQSAHDLSEALDTFLLEGDLRPTSKSMGRWLESMFGAERATLKKAISQGASVGETLERLAALEEPRTVRLRGTDPLRRTDPAVTTLSGGAGTPATDAAAPSPSGRGLRAGAMIVAGGLVAAVAMTFIGRGGAPVRPGEVHSAAARATARLEIKSDPPGAHVFVDGSPSGLKTPAVLDGLTVGDEVAIRLDKDGYEPVTKQLRVAERPPNLSLTLRPALGAIRLEGLPRRAVAYLDDVAVAVDQPLAAPAGAHRLRLEVDQTVLVSRTIELVAGAETVVDVEKERSGR